MVEFPSAAQIVRILREEGIPSSAAEQAFGHMGGGRRRTSKKPKRNGAPKTSVISAREGVLQLMVTDETGRSRRLQFAVYAGPDTRLRGGLVATEMDRGHSESFIRPQDIETTMDVFGVPPNVTKQVFRGALTGKIQAPLASALTVYGGRNTAIGHMGAIGGMVAPVGGIVPGSLVVFVKPTKQVVVNFETNLSEDTKAEKPIRWGKEWLGNEAPGGRAATWDEAYKKSQEFGIPESAFMRAFGHMISGRRRRQMEAGWAGKSKTRQIDDE